MTRPLDRHLDSDEIDALISSVEVRTDGEAQLSDLSLEDLRHHLESCEYCSQKVQMHKSVQNEISKLTKPVEVPLTRDCVSEMEWFNVAAELLPEERARELLSHAAQCGYCGSLLRSAMEILSDELNPGEEQLLAEIESGKSNWQQTMVKILSESQQDCQLPKATVSVGMADLVNEQPNRQRAVADALPYVDEQHKSHRSRAAWWKGLFSTPRMGLAIGAFAFVVIIVGWLGVRSFLPLYTDHLLAQAYSEHRTFELRITGAKYAPLQVERGENKFAVDRSPSLLEAEALIGQNLLKQPHASQWLHAKARADLLEGNYDSAIDVLQPLLVLQPESTSLLCDLASAYYERAVNTSSASDFNTAKSLLDRALEASPNDQVALFNRAVVSERLLNYEQAVGDWNHYLRLDSEGLWANEARDHLRNLREKQKTHDRSALTDPARFSTASSYPTLTSPLAES